MNDVVAVIESANFYPLDEGDNIMVPCDYITVTFQVPRNTNWHPGKYKISRIQGKSSKGDNLGSADAVSVPDEPTS